MKGLDLRLFKSVNKVNFWHIPKQSWLPLRKKKSKKLFLASNTLQALGLVPQRGDRVNLPLTVFGNMEFLVLARRVDLICGSVDLAVRPIKSEDNELLDKELRISQKSA